jgi:hypothetical protein
MPFRLRSIAAASNAVATGFRWPLAIPTAHEVDWPRGKSARTPMTRYRLINGPGLRSQVTWAFIPPGAPAYPAGRQGMKVAADPTRMKGGATVMPSAPGRCRHLRGFDGFT